MDSAFAIICWRDKILLFLRDDIPTIPTPNCWTLPGGRIKPRETPQQALKRELIEEVSYCPKNLAKLGKFKRGKGFAHLYYSFIEDQEALKFTHTGLEGQGIGFFTIKEMEKIKLAPRLRRRFWFLRDSLHEALKKKSFKNFKI